MLIRLRNLRPNSLEKHLTMNESLERSSDELEVSDRNQGRRNGVARNGHSTGGATPQVRGLLELNPGKRIANYPMLVIGASHLSHLAEPFHTLRITLDSWRADRSTSVILVTSALSGEGKSYIAFNLAACFASAGINTLFVDADLRSSTISRALNPDSYVGLSNYLADGFELGDCTYGTSTRTLSVLPAGNSPQVVAGAAELLGSIRMRQLVSELRANGTYTLVVIDAPAAEPVPDARLLMPLVDGVLPVVSAYSTPRAVVKQMLQRIDGVPIVGMVLNRFEPPRSRRSSYYYSKARNR